MENKDLWGKVKDSIADRKLMLGPYFSRQMLVDTKHVLFTMARYKFVAKLIGENRKLDVLELGCNEGIGSLMLSGCAKRVVAVDFDEKAVTWARENIQNDVLNFKSKDFLKEVIGKFDAVVSIDVIEHIPKEQEALFVERICDNLNDAGYCIVGTPNITASQYACEPSKIGHVNLFSAERLRDLFLKRFKNVFLFGMNDEVMHTGFYPMCHYLFVLACNRR